MERKVALTIKWWSVHETLYRFALIPNVNFSNYIYEIKVILYAIVLLNEIYIMLKFTLEY